MTEIINSQWKNRKTHLNCPKCIFRGAFLGLQYFQVKSKHVANNSCCICSSDDKNHLLLTPRPYGCPMGYPWGTHRVPWGQIKTYSNQKFLPMEIFTYALVKTFITS